MTRKAFGETIEIGDKFGTRLVIEQPFRRVAGDRKRWFAKVECDCGKVSVVSARSLQNRRGCPSCVRVLEPDVRIGDMYGKRTVIGDPYRREAGSFGNMPWFVSVRCVCGTESEATITNLVESESCEHCRNTVHGYSKSESLYGRWKRMRQRCGDPFVDEYKNYGGRGISVCLEWDDYTLFRKWAYENGYEEGTKLSLDRIDNDGNYSPDNCRFATAKQQANNKRPQSRLTSQEKYDDSRHGEFVE